MAPQKFTWKIADKRENLNNKLSIVKRNRIFMYADLMNSTGISDYVDSSSL